uniref:EF-hand domain pair, mitogen-activated protein (MAP) kinase n=1 Tax=Tanacetum cinerariifolium TaxID=118510 RepID=A0A6L2N3N0_TANCI|nr:EF-hand domain pair, mitogen-activated protein (MAP) kinase [Tanacetum cinerariifolium]
MKVFHGGTFTPSPNRKYFGGKIPNKTLDWGLRALASDDDVVNLSQYVKDNKVIDAYIEHGKTTIESYYMPKFNESAQIRDLDDNNEVIDLD